jgi:hypothetical protein
LCLKTNVTLRAHGPERAFPRPRLTLNIPVRVTRNLEKSLFDVRL